jgi:hypothetical protein
VNLDTPVVSRCAYPNDEKPEKKPSLMATVHDAPRIALTAAPPEAVNGGGAEVLSAANTAATPFSGETRE